MQKKISLVIYGQTNNEIFNADNINVNRDNCMSAFHSLKEGLSKNGFDLSTCDINKESDSVLSLYFDLSTPVSLQSKINYLILQESEVINPFGWNQALHNEFDRVYTWSDELVDDVKYFKLNFSHQFPSQKQWEGRLVDWNEKKLCTLISGNKSVNHKYELYSERVDTIKWFEGNTPTDDFEFYGVGWDKPQHANKYINYLLKNMAVIKVFFQRYERYKGPVESKNEVLKGYKFAICYENAQMIPGYITEKIFDCFFAGCVPVYWGAPNITEHIPEDCFIDRTKFNTHEELYSYMNNMTPNEFRMIQRNIKNYLFSQKADPYRAENFANVLVRNILNDQ